MSSKIPTNRKNDRNKQYYDEMLMLRLIGSNIEISDLVSMNTETLLMAYGNSDYRTSHMSTIGTHTVLVSRHKYIYTIIYRCRFQGENSAHR
jgi:hypothetical protein